MKLFLILGSISLFSLVNFIAVKVTRADELTADVQYHGDADLFGMEEASSFLPAGLVGVIYPDLEKEIDRVIGAPPSNGSAEDQLDMTQVMDFQEKRSEQQCADASTEANVSLQNFFGGQKGPLTNGELEQLRLRLAPHLALAGVYSMLAKDIYKRPRPYLRSPDVKPCIPHAGSTFAYPSGHALVAQYMARVLSDIYPKRGELLMKRAEEIATNRVLGGVHHPTDIAAGKKLANYLVEKLKKF